MSHDDVLRDLVQRAVEGDDVALARLVAATTADVTRLCTTLGSVDEVDDLVQETYLRVMRSLPGYRGDAPVRAWLLAVARNVCADHVRRRERQRRLVGRITERFVPEHAPAPAAPDRSAALLAVLSPERREAFVLTQVMDLSYEEAATVLGCPIGTVRSRVHRAREELMVVVRREADGTGG